MTVLQTSARGLGVAVGRAILWKPSVQEAPGAPVHSFDEALALTVEALSEAAADNDIFAAQMEMARDPMLEEMVSDALAQGKDAVTAVREACESICSMFMEIDDEYMRSRVDDVRDVCRRIESFITGSTRKPSAALTEGCVVVAEELSPSDTASMDLSKVVAFVTEKGSSTSHVCIIAKSRGIVALTGVTGCMSSVSDGDVLIVDAERGAAVINPDEETLAKAAECQRTAIADFQPAITPSGQTVPVLGNAGSVDDVRRCIASGADGIGLFRSEFLFMESGPQLPGEEQQFRAYRDAALACKGKPLTVRTLDIGGDKSAECLELPEEDNPFLGWRAIRICLDRPEMFLTQLRAILRASVYGNVRIMFPMISTLDELLSARKLLAAAMTQVDDCDRNIKVGMMVETPAAVLMCREMADYVDFFSIGTNDLTQYVMAADRGNSRVSKLYDPFNEAVLRCIRMTAECPVPVCVCGEMASDPRATSILLSCGVSQLSVSAPCVAGIKQAVRQAVIS